jgi:phage shock protein PspC (stress-responsive transcriptional regulator)
MDEIPESQIDTSEPKEPREPGEPGLHRSTKRRMIGGVAGGLGERFDVDPNIFRVIFVVLTVLWGLGAAIYLVMWVLIPRSSPQGDSTAPDDVLPASKSPWLYYAVLAGVAGLAVILVTAVGGAPQFGSGFAALWLIFLVALAILALRAPARQFSIRRFIAALFLLFVSLLIVLTGSFLGFLESTGVPISGGDGSRVWQPTTLSQVRSTYRTEFGSSTVDLSNVSFPPSGFTVTSTVSVGNLIVDLPANAIVDLKTHVGIGSVSYQLWLGNEILPQFQAVPSSLKSAASQKAAPHLTVDAEVGIGRILIVRTATNPG